MTNPLPDADPSHAHRYRFGVAALQRAYANGLRPADHLRSVYDRIAAAGVRPVWISLMPPADALATLADATARRAEGADLPLYGVPFAVKDNIDVAGLPTTAGCPDYAYDPAGHATVVARLVAAGAIPVGKTNLDQFATGLNGTRSPYGAPACIFDKRYVSGGSSSGSAVAVGLGLVAFSLGTDTAGSGRVPAAFNNIVGLKPTKGLVSTSGVVPAVRSQDCVSVFAATVADALAVTRVAAGYDAADPYSRRAPPDALVPAEWPAGFRFGVPRPDQLAFFGDDDAAALFAAAVARLEALGGRRVAFDFAPFRDAAALLYDGPWVAERLAAIADLAAARPDAIHPVVRDIVLSGARFSAVDAFKGQYRLAALAREAEAQWAGLDVMLLPTAPTIHTIDAMLADPVRLNSQFGAYTNFVNLMDLSALAVPAGFRPNGLPFGVTLVGRAFADGRIAALGDRLHRALPDATLAGSAEPLPACDPVRSEPSDTIEIAVVGAHLSGEPLNHQLVDGGARLRRSARTGSSYSLYALAGTAPQKPGLIRDGVGAGGIEVEVWALAPAAFGRFVAAIPSPLGIGRVSLEDGSSVPGFLCEPAGLTGARDITAFGGWRAYRASLATGRTDL